MGSHLQIFIKPRFFAGKHILRRELRLRLNDVVPDGVAD